MHTTSSSELSLPGAGLAQPCVAEPGAPEPAFSVCAPFVDRRAAVQRPVGGERRQFASSHQGLSPEARELALAIDSYKLEHRRRYVTFEEMLQVIHTLGYRK